MEYDAIIIGGGISGLTAASLLAKRKLSVVVVEKSYNPGGSCGIFKRGQVTFNNGAAMLSDYKYDCICNLGESRAIEIGKVIAYLDA